MGAEIIALAGLALAAGGTTHQVSESNNARRTAKMTGDTQKQKLAAQEAEVAKREEVAEQTEIRDEERARLRASSAALGGRQSTILTSPLGTGSGAIADTAGTKTALGV